METRKDIQAQIDKLDQRIDFITNNPGGFVQEKLDLLDYHLHRVPERPKPKDGGRTMHRHLELLREEWVASPENRIQAELTKLTNYKDKLILELESMPVQSTED